ncbi:MAG: Na+/H+ antiporter subunit D [Firmicutes bacterium]|nr:Na+/H+ antiporter subunit D [Bacillota bacterium]
MSPNGLALPVVLPMLTGIALILLPRRAEWQRRISAVSTAVGFLIAVALIRQVRAEGIQVLYVGDFPAPFGIVFVGDLLSTLLVALNMLVAAAVLWYAFLTMDPERERFFFYPLFQFLLMGINGAFLTGDIFNLFVWFEVLLIASYILLTLGGEPYQLQEGFKYVMINMLASTLFLVSVSVLYGTLGTLNMADMAVKIAEVKDSPVVAIASVLLLIVFGIKAAIFPLYFWLPRSYVAPPGAVTAFFGGVMTKVGVYAMVRVYTLLFGVDDGFTYTLLVWIAGLSMVVGILGTLAQMDFKRILTWHIISQIGYMVMGLAIFTPLALAGAIYYVAHIMVVKTALFLASGVTEKLTGTTNLKKMSGLLTTHPALGALFFVGGLSLAGVPPLSGFFGKFTLIQAGLAEGRYGIVATAVGVSLFTLFSMIKIFRTSFWGEVRHKAAADRAVDLRTYGALLGPLALLVAVSVGMGLGAQFTVGYVLESAHQLLQPSLYIQAVLGSGLGS